jgi:hypothetical protein
MFPRELRVPAETANSFKAREVARPRALRPDPEQTFVASNRMARIDVKLLLQIATENVANGQVSGPCV